MMTPQDAQRMQADIYRRMTPEEKIDIACGMWEFAQELQQIGRQLEAADLQARPLTDNQQQ